MEAWRLEVVVLSKAGVGLAVREGCLGNCPIPSIGPQLKNIPSSVQITLFLALSYVFVKLYICKERM